MSIEITCRHVEIEEDIKQHAHNRAEAIMVEFPMLESIHVILDGEKFRKKAEAVVQGKNHVRFESSQTSDNMVGAIDKAADRIERQLRKVHDKIIDHRA